MQQKSIHCRPGVDYDLVLTRMRTWAQRKGRPLLTWWGQRPWTCWATSAGRRRKRRRWGDSFSQNRVYVLLSLRTNRSRDEWMILAEACGPPIIASCLLDVNWQRGVQGMSEQLLVRLTKQNSSRDMFSPIQRNTRNNKTQALLTESLRQVDR